MATDRQLYEKLGKLLDAAQKQAEGQDEHYRERCYLLIYNKFWEIQGKIKTPTRDYYPRSYFESDEEKMKGIYEWYTKTLWLLDVMDAVSEGEDPLEDEN